MSLAQGSKSINWVLALRLLARDTKNRRLYQRLLRAGPKGLHIKELEDACGLKRNELQQRLSRLQKLNLLAHEQDRYFVSGDVAAQAKFMMRWFIPIGFMIVPRTLPASVVAVPAVFYGFPPELIKTWGMLVLWVFWLLTTYTWVRRAQLSKSRGS